MTDKTITIKPYNFTSDTCPQFRLVSMLVFADFIGKPTKYLEIGVFEGMSGCSRAARSNATIVR